MVARKELSRKASFVAALSQAGMTATAWADTTGVSKTMLYRTLRDPKQSAPLTAKIDQFIARYVPASTRSAA